MTDRFRRLDREEAPPQAPDNGGAVATDEQGYATDDGTAARTSRHRAGTAAAGNGTCNRAPAEDAVVLDREARLRQRDEFGGINWGAAFFGWIVALGIGVLLTAIVAPPAPRSASRMRPRPRRTLRRSTRSTSSAARC